MMNCYETAGSEVPTLDASFVIHPICAEATIDHLEGSLVMKVGVSDHAVAHHRGGKIFETEVSQVLIVCLVCLICSVAVSFLLILKLSYPDQFLLHIVPKWLY